MDVLLTLNKDGQFFGATWFLGDLFVVSVLYKLMDLSIECRKNKKLYLAILFGIVGSTGLSITFWNDLSRTMVLSMFYAMGVCIKQYQEELSDWDKPIIEIFCLAIYIIIASHSYVSMGSNEYSYRGLFVVGALCGSYAFLGLMRILYKCDVMKKMFMQLGKNSIDIVIWQFVVFRIIIALQLVINELPLNRVLDYYPTYDTRSGWWIVYILVGLYGSLFIGWTLNKMCKVFEYISAKHFVSVR